jgi:flagellar hook-associated protein 3 FlgL
MIGGISTLGSMLRNSWQIQSMQTQMNQITTEIASGRKTDPLGPLGGNAALLYQLHAQSDQQTALQTTVTNALGRLDATQTALSAVGTAVQSIVNDALTPDSSNGQGQSVLANEAQNSMAQVISQLNTQYEGSSLFSGDNTNTAPMQAADAAGGPLATVNSVLATAVSVKGGPLTASDINSFISGPNGLASVFNDTNSNPALNYGGAFYTAPDDGKPTTLLIGATQTLQYNVNGNQQGFRDLMQGLSMLTMLGAPPSQLDDSAKAALQTQASALIGQAQNELTTQQGLLGVTQAALQNVADQQQAAANATQKQILGFEQADTTADATTLSTLQTQLQATYAITAEISQLTLTHYLPTLTS